MLDPSPNCLDSFFLHLLSSESPSIGFAMGLDMAYGFKNPIFDNLVFRVLCNSIDGYLGYVQGLA